MPGDAFQGEAYQLKELMRRWSMDADIGIRAEKYIVWIVAQSKRQSAVVSIFNLLKGFMWLLVMKAASLQPIAIEREKESRDNAASLLIRGEN